MTIKRHQPYGKLQPLPQPNRPFEEISLDFITGLPEVYDGQRLINSLLVIVDRFTKYALFFPISTTIDAAELARLVHNEVELRYGTPRDIVSDRGSVFTSYQPELRLDLEDEDHSGGSREFMQDSRSSRLPANA